MHKSLTSEYLVKHETVFTMFENHRKSRIQHCERSELRLHFEQVAKVAKIAKIAEIAKIAKVAKVAKGAKVV